MAKLACADYGFECRYETEGDDDVVVSRFMRHSLDEHGIEYSYGGLRQFLLRKTGSFSQDSQVHLAGEDVRTIISILEYASDFLPLSAISDGKIDANSARQIIEKLSCSLHAAAP
ncbi:MAG: DUF1059 domain-containing protein [Thaumarchaeota archaeon]|nr:DUF1059 domain-containing protein [Nitrososphaerota archaeon]